MSVSKKKNVDVFSLHLELAVTEKSLKNLAEIFLGMYLYSFAIFYTGFIQILKVKEYNPLLSL